MVTLDDVQMEWLAKQGNASLAVRELIDEKMMKLARELDLGATFMDDERERKEMAELKENTEKSEALLKTLNVEERLALRREFRDSHPFDLGVASYFKWIVKNKIKA